MTSSIALSTWVISVTQAEDPQTLPPWHPLQATAAAWLPVESLQASSCDVSPNLKLAFPAIKMKHALKEKEMHLYYFLQCHYLGWLLIKMFLELESVITVQEGRHGNFLPGEFWRLKSKSVPYTCEEQGARCTAWLPSAMPPIDCGFYPLSTAVREQGKDERKTH